ncbi:MAG: hypothetical protein ACR2JO_04990, partial [Mycobacteriales bacterium]
PRGGVLGPAFPLFAGLVSADTLPVGAAPLPYVDALVATAETVRPGRGPTPCTSTEEMEVVLRWLETPGTRLVELTGEWSSPAYGAAGALVALHPVTDRAAVTPLDDRRRLRPAHRPARDGPWRG